MTWLTNWNRRKLITVNGSTAGTQSDYQMKLIINQTSGTDSIGIVYLGDNILSNFNDLRFTKSDGITTLNYWIESITGTSPNQTATVWIKLAPSPDTIPASPGTYNFYIYYNNSSVTTPVSDVSTTFIRDVSNIIGSWDLDGDAIDRSGNGNNGTLYGGMGYTTGKFGLAANFEGSGDCIKLGNPSVLQPANDLSISAWFKTSGSYGYLVAQADNSVNQGYALWYSTDRIKWTIVSASTDFLEAAASNNNTWQHVVVTFKKSISANIYRNGGLSATDNSVGTISYSGVTAINIGASTVNSLYYIGAMEHVRIYNRTLSTPEISDLYNNYGYVTPNYPGHELIRKYISPEPIFGTTGTEELGVTATLMTITQSETPCRTGICTVTANVTWQNLGSSSITFRPTIIIDGATYVQAASDTTIVGAYPATSSPIQITTPVLTVGTHTICPYPN